MPTTYDMSTAGIDPPRRLDFWREGARAIGGMQHSIPEDGLFEGAARMTAVGGLKFGRLRVSPNEARWTRDLIRQTDGNFLRMIMQREGVAEIEQGELRFVLRPGQWAILNTARPHMIRSHETIEELILIVPATSLTPRLFDATRRLPGAMAGHGHASPLLRAFTNALLTEAYDGPAMIDSRLEGAALELFKAVIEEELGGQIGTTCRELRVERIRAYIERHLSDPGLSIERIADAMGCSKRYLHALFAGGESLHRLIWTLRLSRCARDLKRRELAGTSITTISLSHGFSCPAHFSRLFKAHYAMAPRDYRHAWLDS